MTQDAHRPADATDPTWPEVKAAYWRNRRAHVSLARTDPPLADKAQDADFWAWEYVDALWRAGDLVALDRLVDLADSTIDDRDLGYLGAGPVEDLVRVFGEVLIDYIERAAARSPNFLRALQGMYPTLIPESIRVRMLPLVPVTVTENRIRQAKGKEPL